MLERCIESVTATEYPDFQGVIVDNGSVDRSVQNARQSYPNILIVQNLSSLGLGSAYNKAVGATTGEFLVFLNNDIEVDPRWLKALVEFAVRQEANILQPEILFLHNRSIVNSVGNELPIAGFGHCGGIGEHDNGQYDRPRQVGYASGACLFVWRDVFDKLGGFDETCLGYGSDIDLGGEL